MAAATLKQVREGIAANLASVPGVTIYSKRPLEFSPPFIWVRPPDGSEFMSANLATNGAFNDWTMVCEAVAGANDPLTAEDTFHSLFWSTVQTAIESDHQLGGVAQDLTVSAIQNYVVAPTPEGKTLVGAEWLVEVIA